MQSSSNAGCAPLTWRPGTAQAPRRRMRRTTSAAARAARPCQRAPRTLLGRREPARRARSAAASRATTGSACLGRLRRRRRRRLQAQVSLGACADTCEDNTGCAQPLWVWWWLALAAPLACASSSSAYAASLAGQARSNQPGQAPSLQRRARVARSGCAFFKRQLRLLAKLP